MCRPILILFFLAAFSQHVISQGCSDAGFCTMGAMKPDQNYSRRIAIKLRSIELNYYLASTPISPVIQAYTVDGTIGLNDLTAVQIKVPYMIINGNFGHNEGLGDISISATRTLKSTRQGTFSATLGTKIPTNESNAEVGTLEHGPANRQFPMYYQTSLGTYDIIAGGSFINEKWLFATGIQIPLNENKNEFTWGAFSGYPSRTYLEKNPRAYHLKRGTDIMIRAERNFRFTNFNFSVGLLPIYRITRDEITNANFEREKLDDGQGLAMSILLGAGYHFNVNSSLKAIFGQKLVQREINPDGLTREQVFSCSYVYRF